MPSLSDIWIFIEPLANNDTYSVFAILIFIGCILFFMQPRRFYIVRHGETVSNAQHVRQGEHGLLSERGCQQADEVGKYLKQFPIKRILSSPFPRAIETANIINAYFKVPIIPSPLFAERRNPSVIIGKLNDDPEARHIIDQIDLAYHADDFRLLDEETFEETRLRAEKCLDLLSAQVPREMAIVTHHVFLKMLVAYLLYRDQLHSSDFIKVSYFNYSDNAGITVFAYHPWKALSARRGWEVVSYNEQPTLFMK